MKVSSRYLLGFTTLLFVACQTPETKIQETDANLETRVFSKLEQGKAFDLTKAVIIDVRSRFDYNMSRLPRSFFADYRDWDLKNYHRNELVEKQKDLERLLALNGIDPLISVVILGKGLQGNGEEFLMAATLNRMGIERVSFMNAEQAKNAITSRNVPPLANVPYWHRELKTLFTCPEGEWTEAQNLQKADVVIADKSIKGGTSNLTAKQVFTPQLQVIPQAFPKNKNINIYSPNSFWAYGLGLYLKEQGRTPCVL